MKPTKKRVDLLLDAVREQLFSYQPHILFLQDTKAIATQMRQEHLYSWQSARRDLVLVRKWDIASVRLQVNGDILAEVVVTKLERKTCFRMHTQ